MSGIHPLLPIADRIRMDRSRPKAVGRYRRARGFFIAIDGGFPVEARRLPMLAAEMESQSNSIQFQNR